MTLHLPTIPGVDRNYTSCAYTQKAVKLSRMFPEEVALYHVESEAKPNDTDLRAWDAYNARQAGAISMNAEPGDLLLIGYGDCQQSIATRVDLPAVEYGIGYGGTFARYRVFESYAWMHAVLGSQQGAHAADGSSDNVVIPNYFDPEEFPEGKGDGGYLLYMGRLIERKGVRLAETVAKALDRPLILAGPQGDYIPSYGEYLGLVGAEKRAELLGGAEALLAPTVYLEPFGGVAVEAMLTGTPAITSDWGAFTETVCAGLSGYRGRNLSELIEGTYLAGDLDRSQVRKWALERYSLEAVRPQYEDFFDYVRSQR